MRILADENCDRLLVTMLREAGHDVSYVAESARGESDVALMQQARAEQRAILTSDRDFGLLAERDSGTPPAVILLRLDALGRPARAKRAADVVRMLGDTPDDELVVVEPGQIRRRPYRHP
jgi:predicted nuclease of predicted toxin-antitoxin system